MGGTMRLKTSLYDKEGTIAERIYKLEISERHRHRYELNPAYFDKLQKGVLLFLEHLQITNWQMIRLWRASILCGLSVSSRI